MSDEAKKSDEPKLRLNKNLASNEDTDAAKQSSDSENAPSEASIEAPKKTFKLRRPATGVPFKAPPPEPSEQSAPQTPPPPAPKAAPEKLSPPEASAEDSQPAEFPPPPPIKAKEPEAAKEFPPPPKAEPKPSTDNIAKEPPKSRQEYNVDDPFGDVLPKPDPKTGKRTTRAPFPAGDNSGTTSATPQSSGKGSTSKTKRIFHPGNSSNNRGQEANKQFERKLQKLNAPNSEKKKSNLLVSILVIAALIVVLFGCGAGIWYVLRSDEPKPAEVSDTNAENSEASQSTDTTSTNAQSEDPIEVKPIPVNMGPAPTVDSSSETASSPTAPQNFSEAVTTFLNSVHIGGMRTGTTPRVMLNEVTYQVGDVVDPNTGLSFEGIRNQRLMFKDKKGVLYMKSF